MAVCSLISNLRPSYNKQRINKWSVNWDQSSMPRTWPPSPKSWTTGRYSQPFQFLIHSSAKTSRRLRRRSISKFWTKDWRNSISYTTWGSINLNSITRASHLLPAIIPVKAHQTWTQTRAPRTILPFNYQQTLKIESAAGTKKNLRVSSLPWASSETRAGRRFKDFWYNA